jgi:uncharacterized protein (TIGR00730 family)
MQQVYYEEAARFAQWIGETGRTLVYGGSRCGMMETIAQNAKQAGATIYGIVPRKVMMADMASDNIDVTIHTDRLSDRKEFLINESDVMVVMPGSVGTLDEAFSAIASHTFGENGKTIIFYNINGFWNKLFELFQQLEQEGVVNKPLVGFVRKADTLEQLIGIIEQL